MRTNANVCDLSTVLPENVEEEVKQQAEISMGSEISDEDILNITHLCDQVCSCRHTALALRYLLLLDVYFCL